VTLVEILIGVVLLGGLTMTTVGALGMIASVSEQQKAVSVAEAEGRRLAEKVRAMQYVPCALPDSTSAGTTSQYDDAITSSDYDTTVVTSVKITAVSVWNNVSSFNGTPTWTAVDPSNPGTCADHGGLQKITLELVVDGQTTDITFVKRNIDTKLS
jgi:type II secretory pathway pseudopilin PulG